MSERVQVQPSPEQRVFGDAFAFKGGDADEATKKAYFVDRLEQLRNGETVWLARNLEADAGVCADLRKASEILATLEFDYDSRSAFVTVSREEFGDTSLCERVTFDEAVVAAEEYVATLQD